MAVSIRTNIASLGAQKNLTKVTDELSSVYERLSSGLRINKASDDAAGLAVAATLNADTRTLTKALSNAGDGLSALTIAGQGLQALSEINQRQLELATQAANGTLSGNQRTSLDQEFQALSNELNRIISTTKFNGISLLDGSTPSLTLQVGTTRTDSLNLQLPGATTLTRPTQSVITYTPTGTLTAAVTVATGGSPFEIKSGDLNGDGKLDVIIKDTSTDGVRILINNGDGTFSTGQSFVIGGNVIAFHIADLDNNGTLDLIATKHSGTVGIYSGVGNGTFTYSGDFVTGSQPWEVTPGDFNGDGKLDLIAGTTGNETILLGNGDRTFKAPQDILALNVGNVSVGDLNNDGKLDVISTRLDYPAYVTLGNGDGTFKAPIASTGGFPYRRTATAIGDINGDGKLDVLSIQPVDIGFSNATVASSSLGDGTGNLNQVQFITLANIPPNIANNVLLADITNDGKLDAIFGEYGGILEVYAGIGDGTFGTKQTYTDGLGGGVIPTVGDFNGDGVLDIIGSDSSGAVFLFAGGANATTVITPLTITTKDNALTSITALNQFQQDISQQQAIIGAESSRVGFAIAVIQSSTLNLRSALSRITDADIAQETSALVRDQILQKAGATILAQANLDPYLVLKLLG